MLYYHQCQRGRLLKKIDIVYCLWCYKKCHTLTSQCLPRSRGRWRQFSVSVEHSTICQIQMTMSIELTWETKESWKVTSVNQAHSITKENSQKSVSTKFTRGDKARLSRKPMLTELTWLMKENLFWLVSTEQGRLTKDFLVSTY